MPAAAREDGRAASIWDAFAATPGKIKDGSTPAVACDHYHLYREDVALMKRLGLDAYRFSVSWSRVAPDGAANEKGLDFYSRLIDELRAKDIEPWLCLYHWDLPQALHEKGGWTNRDIADWFQDYAELLARRFGDRVARWATFNEPGVFTIAGYAVGYHAPGVSDFGAYLARCRELKDPAAAFAESTLAHFGYALPYHPLPGAPLTPYVCLRVPTGGGKTRLAGQAIRRVNEQFLATEHALVLWLVPSEPIREQTLRALKTPGELLHEDMRALFGAVHVLDIDAALAGRHDLPKSRCRTLRLLARPGPARGPVAGSVPQGRLRGS